MIENESESMSEKESENDTEIALDPRDTPLGEYVRDVVARKSYDQLMWIARTVDGGLRACLAGHAALDAGYRPLYTDVNGTAVASLATRCAEQHGGEVMPVHEAGRRAMGLTEPQATAMFGALLDSDDLVRMADDVASLGQGGGGGRQ